MPYLIAFVVNAVVGASLVWLAVKLVDRHNRKNTLRRALVAGVVLGLMGMIPFLPGLGILVLAYFLLNYYDLGIPEILAVLLILMAAFAGLGMLQVRMVNA